MAVEIAKFREILFWPWHFEGKNGREQLGELRNEAGCWVEQADWFERRYNNQTPQSKSDRPYEARYGEFLYFHPFVQRFLFGPDRPVTAWQRQGIDAVTVEWKGNTRTLDVEQCWLFWFSLGEEGRGVAMLALEVASQPSDTWALAEAEDFLDCFRRVYPPYAYEERRPREKEGWKKLGRFPAKVGWGERGAQPTECFLEFLEEVSHSRTYPIAAHWRQLLCPANPQARVLGNIRQIEDDRMPSMAYLALKDPRALSRGDFIRLCFADDGGDSRTLPYAPGFLADFERDYCYDRYWDADGRRRGTDWHTTRYLNCGYAFTMIGEDGGFFADADSGGLSHFRNHYFLMGLVVHFQKAALLAFSSRLSLNKFDHGNLKQTLADFLAFTSDYWFVDLSNQLQAQEIYAQWRGHLRLDALYRQVKEESTTVIKHLDAKAKDLEQKRGAQLTLILGLASALIGLSQLLTDTEKQELLRYLGSSLPWLAAGKEEVWVRIWGCSPLPPLSLSLSPLFRFCAG